MKEKDLGLQVGMAVAVVVVVVVVVVVAVLVVPLWLFPVKWLGCELSCDNEDDDEEGNDGCDGCGVACEQLDGSVGEDDGASEVKSLLPTGEKALTYPFEALIDDDDDDVVPLVLACDFKTFKME